MDRNPFLGYKWVRLRSPDLSRGRFFMKRTRGIRKKGSRGDPGPNFGISGSGGRGPMYAIISPGMPWVNPLDNRSKITNLTLCAQKTQNFAQQIKTIEIFNFFKYIFSKFSGGGRGPSRGVPGGPKTQKFCKQKKT